MTRTPLFIMVAAILLGTASYVSSQTFLGIINGGTVVGNNAATGNIPSASSSPVLGAAGSSTGQLGFSGTTSGTVTVKPQAAAGTYNYNLPATAGTAGQPQLSGGGGGAPQTYGTLGVAGGGTNCAVASGTCLDNISGFAGTGFVQRTGPGTYSFGTSANVASLCGAQGLTITNGGTPDTTITVTYDQLVMLNTTGTPIYRSGTGATFTIDTLAGNATSAANGMDGEVLPVADWVNIWAIDNGTAAAGLGATSATAPTMPAGYTYKCRLGAMRTTASALLRTLQAGSRTQYKVTAATNTAAYPLASTGSVGNVNVTPFPVLSLAAYVPPTAASSQMLLGNIATGSANALSANTSTDIWNSITNPPACVNNVSNSLLCDLTLETAQTVYYAANGGANNFLAVIGWKDKVSAN